MKKGPNFRISEDSKRHCGPGIKGPGCYAVGEMWPKQKPSMQRLLCLIEQGLEQLLLHEKRSAAHAVTENAIFEGQSWGLTGRGGPHELSAPPTLRGKGGRLDYM